MADSRIKVDFFSKKVCYGVYLYENCQRQSYKAFTGDAVKPMCFWCMLIYVVSSSAKTYCQLTVLHGARNKTRVSQGLVVRVEEVCRIAGFVMWVIFADWKNMHCLSTDNVGRLKAPDKLPLPSSFYSASE